MSFKLSKSILIAALMLFSSVPSTIARQVSKSDAAKAFVAKGSALLKQRKYKEAQALFKAACSKDPRNKILQYYLGYSSICIRDMRQAQAAFTNTVIMTTHKDPYHIKAQESLSKYFHVQPYSALRGHRLLARWDQRTMPLKIYISDGKMLPNNMGDRVLGMADVDKVCTWTRNPGFMRSLSTSNLYRRNLNGYIRSGIQQWSWATGERLLSFQFTNDFREADVIVFWTNKLQRFTGFAYCPNYPKHKHDPAFIVMSLEHVGHPKYTTTIEAIACHEFGHILGLDHSQNTEDVMYPQARTADKKQISKGDKATLRALYKIPPDVLFLSRVKKVSNAKVPAVSN